MKTLLLGFVLTLSASAFADCTLDVRSLISRDNLTDDIKNEAIDLLEKKGFLILNEEESHYELDIKSINLNKSGNSSFLGLSPGCDYTKYKMSALILDKKNTKKSVVNGQYISTTKIHSSAQGTSYKTAHICTDQVQPRSWTEDRYNSLLKAVKKLEACVD